MEYWKKVLAGLKTHFNFVVNTKKGVIKVSDSPFEKPTEIKIGGTTYIVSSYFKNDAKSSAVDKVSRLIERDTENMPDD